MKGIFWSAVLIAVTAVFSCGGKTAADVDVSGEAGSPSGMAGVPAAFSASMPEDAGSASGAEAAGPDGETVFKSLERIAGTERMSGYVQGLALAESRLREEAGDYAGAAVAAYKELAWLYGYGAVPRSSLEEGLNNVTALENGTGETDGAGMIQDGVPAARALLRFLAEDWAEAERLLSALPVFREEADGFIRWLLLVCAMERGPVLPETQSSYGSIGGRYGHFPEYWYRGARAMRGTLAAEYAERCVSLAPEGPFALECRGIMARALGLAAADGPSVLTRAEIERVISRAAAERKPEYLSVLMPLLSLPDNTGTLYAVGALRALGQAPEFRLYFSAQAAKAGGRLAERLAYIVRG
ncbi:MAG: hypothetical protein LBI86_06390 [Treponema sp.]|jgi:hypothetical protein|nr:hypothetical protein [Treponema sp.]